MFHPLRWLGALSVPLLMGALQACRTPAPVDAPAVHAVWAVPSLVRIGERDPVGASSAAEIWAARGEYESFQIVIRAGEAGLTNVSVAVTNLSGPGGATIPASALAVYREHYVTVSMSSPVTSSTTAATSIATASS